MVLFSSKHILSLPFFSDIDTFLNKRQDFFHKHNWQTNSPLLSAIFHTYQFQLTILLSPFLSLQTCTMSHKSSHRNTKFI